MMPNHDTTRLVITAPEPEGLEQLLRFTQHYRNIDAYKDLCPEGTKYRHSTRIEPHRADKPCLSHAFDPRPIELMGHDDGGPACDWGRRHWGTKWGTYDETHELTDDRIVITFDSAWNPPWRLFATLAGLFPLLRFDATWHCEFDNKLYAFWFDAENEPDPVQLGEFSTHDEWQKPDGGWGWRTTTHFTLGGERLDPPLVEEYSC